QRALLVRPDRALEGYRLLPDLEHLADLVRRHLHLLRDLVGARLPAVLLNEVAGGADDLVDGLDHVDRDADGPCLVGDGAADRLADPPGSGGPELLAAPVLALLDRARESRVPYRGECSDPAAAVGAALATGPRRAHVAINQSPRARLGLSRPATVAAKDCRGRFRRQC